MSAIGVSYGSMPRRIWHFLGSLILLIAIGWAGLRFQPRAEAWLLVLALMSAFAVLNGHGITGTLWGIFIDSRNKISLSRVQMLAWTLVILSALLTAILTNVASGSDSPLNIQIPPQLWILLGISTASAVGAPALLNAKRAKQADNRELEKTAAQLNMQGQSGTDTEEGSVVLRNTTPEQARWSELLKGDESGNASSVDLGKLQMFFFTFILVCGYGAALYAMFARREGITTLPPVQEGMDMTLGISQAGYLASKAVTVSKEKMEPESAQEALAAGAGKP